MSAKTKYFSVLIRVSLREKILDGKKYRATVPFKGQGWTGVGIDLFLKDLYLVIKQTPPKGDIFSLYIIRYTDRGKPSHVLSIEGH